MTFCVLFTICRQHIRQILIWHIWYTNGPLSRVHRFCIENKHFYSPVPTTQSISVRVMDFFSYTRFSLCPVRCTNRYAAILTYVRLRLIGKTCGLMAIGLHPKHKMCRQCTVSFVPNTRCKIACILWQLHPLIIVFSLKIVRCHWYFHLSSAYTIFRTRFERSFVVQAIHKLSRPVYFAQSQGNFVSVTC